MRMEEHASAVELEFRESMSNRAQKGYILPKQMDILFGVRHTMARLEGERIFALSTMDFKGFAIGFEKRFSISSRNIVSYNIVFHIIMCPLLF